MPCNSDYMAPNGREVQLRETAQLLEYVLFRIGAPRREPVSRAARDLYCKYDSVPALCSILSNPKVRELAEEPTEIGRRLKAWATRHDEADKRRKEQERLEQSDQEWLRDIGSWK